MPSSRSSRSASVSSFTRVRRTHWEEGLFESERGSVRKSGNREGCATLQLIGDQGVRGDRDREHHGERLQRSRTRSRSPWVGGQNSFSLALMGLEISRGDTESTKFLPLLAESERFKPR